MATTVKAMTPNVAGYVRDVVNQISKDYGFTRLEALGLLKDAVLEVFAKAK